MEVLVVGAGLLGCCTAFFLQQNGCRVTVVERRQGPALETSLANAGLLTPGMPDPWNAPGVWKTIWHSLGREDSPMLLRLKALPSLGLWGLRFLANSREDRHRLATERNARLALYNLEVMRNLREGLPLEAYDGSTAGTLKIFRDASALERAKPLSEFVANQGVELRFVGPDEVVEIEPALGAIRSALAGGIFYPRDESGDAHAFCRALVARAEARGVAFRYGATVSHVGVSNGRVKFVTIDRERVSADAYVLAAGSFTPVIAHTAGLRVPIKPCKGYSVTLPRGDWQDGPHLPVIDDALHAAVVPLGDRIRIAGTAEFTGFDPKVRSERIDNLYNLLEAVYPRSLPFLNHEAAFRWAGFRPVPPDGYPIIGKTKWNNLYLNTGHHHLGWTLAVGSGKALADVMCEKKPEIELGPYGPARFD